MIEIYEYNGKIHVRKDNFTLETNKDKNFVENNKEYYENKINQLKGEIDNGK
jgi:predicted RNA-binding protein